MCRLSAFFGAPICAADLVTRPCRSIITQSFDARERMSGDASTPGYLNGDGFGLGWYSSNRADVTPCVYRQARPAWNDPNLGSIAEKVYTPVLFAHVRAASPGLDVSETTCHPFRSGRYLWMHNGGLGNFAKARRSLLKTLSEDAFDFAVTHGSSDTALCFAVFLNLIEDKMAQGSPEKLRICLEETINILEQTMREVDATETSLLNFVVSDGESLAASRYVINLQNDKAKAASLYYASGNSYESDGSAPGNYAMKHTDRRPSLAIISSEPLTERRADWVSVPRNSSIVITKSMHILVSPIHDNPDPHISRILLNLAEPKSPEKRNGTRNHPSRASDKKSYVRKVDQVSESSSGVGTFYAVGSTVRSTITIPGRTVLCCSGMDSLLCSGTDDGSIHVWNMEDCMLSEVLRTGHRPVLAMLSDVEAGVLISATSASSLIVYRLSSEKRFEVSGVVCCEGKGDILSLTKIGPRIYAGFSDAKVRCVIEDIFRVEEYAAVGKLTRDGMGSDASSTGESGIMCTAFDFPSIVGAASHYSYVFAVTSCLQGRFLCTGCGDGLLRVWNVETEECIQKRDDHAGAILALVAYEVEYGTMLFSGSRDRSVKVWVWDGDGGFICKRTLRKHKDEVIFLTLFGDKLVSGSADGTVCVWCAETLALLCQYRDNSLKAGAVSVRYNLLFTASDEGAIQVRDMLSTEKDLDRREALKRNAAHRTQSTESAIKSLSANNAGIRSHSKVLNSKGVKGADAHCKDSGRADTVDCIVSEVHEDTDEAETIVPGVTNEMVLAPPMSPIPGCGKGRTTMISSFLDDSGSTVSNDAASDIECNGRLPGAARLVSTKSIAGEFPTQVLERRLMQDVLARFISFATVPGSEDHREDCWQGARYIGSFLEGLGASVKYVTTTADVTTDGATAENHQLCREASDQPFFGSNPVVLARFASANPAAKTITFYGHYDVMPVDSQQWKTDPWLLTSIDGYLYGRGATDNKGPIVAMVFAIKKLLEDSRDGLGTNLVLVLQGEGERSNAGFKDCIISHRHWFENTSLILTSNSYWLGEEKPCITYGFRGVIDLRVSVTGGTRNLHSGVDGGAIFEPMNDLITVLGSMVDASGVVCIPGFYDDVRPLTEADKKLLEGVEFDVQEYHSGTGVDRFTSENAAELLKSRWRKPSVSITSIETSNASGFYSIVPRQACAKISIRFVPDQDPSKIEKAVTAHLGFEIRKRRSPNTLRVECVNKGDWWLGDPSCQQFQIAERAVRAVWGVNPEYVCEGGSMPLFSYLVKTLDAPLVQVPLGQSSDGAHLPNERMRAVNLFRGKDVLQKIIQEFAESEM